LLFGVLSLEMTAKVAPASRRQLIILALMGFALAGTLAAKVKPKTASNAFDADYVFALATANRFLHAWQTQDHETGVLLLTDAAKHHTSEDHLDAFFSQRESPDHGFEITRGKKFGDGHYRFPVALWQTVPGKKTRPRFSEIIVVRTGKDDWAIDKLP
jgi:hypothetical protein